MLEGSLNGFPDSVRRILARLQEEASTESIWLVGSRANERSTPNSDWDLLVFSSAEPDVAFASSNGVDVIRVGPSRQVFLLEGKGTDFILPFADWEWREIDHVNATYMGKKFADHPSGEARDSSDPACRRSEQHAFRIWSKGRAS